LSGCADRSEGGPVKYDALGQQERFLLVPVADATNGEHLPILGTGEKMTQLLAAELNHRGYHTTVATAKDIAAIQGQMKADQSTLLLLAAVKEWEPDLVLTLDAQRADATSASKVYQKTDDVARRLRYENRDLICFRLVSAAVDRLVSRRSSLPGSG